MRLEKWALVAEIVSAAAIVLSLIFVGVQIQQNSSATAANSAALRSQVRQAMLQTETELVLYAGSNNVLMDPIADAPANFQQRVAVNLMLIRSREYYWIQHKNGLLDDETYRSYLSTFVNNLGSSAAMRETWDRVAQTTEFDPEFIAEIDAAVAAARNEDR